MATELCGMEVKSIPRVHAIEDDFLLADFH